MNNKHRILIADSEPTVRTSITNYFSAMNFDVTSVSDGEAARNAVNGNGIDLVVASLELSKVNGLDLLRHVKQASANTPVITISSDRDVSSAVQAMKYGAYTFMTKPIMLEELKGHIEDALGLFLDPESQTVKNLNVLAKRNLVTKLLESQEANMQEMFSVARVVAGSDSTIFISGESGTGKELMASFIHQNSTRFSGPFSPVNSGAIPENLIESELFGHVKGAFTGAIASRQGRLKTADGGTLFLDEVTELPIHMQVKLLRALQEREFEPVGSSKSDQSNFRVVAATNRDVEKEVEEGRFREDLYYRLNVIPLHIPPLRKHPGDIIPLTNYFIDRFNREKGSEIEGITDEACQRLSLYNWPGNIRELENAVERTVIIKRYGVVTVDDLPRKLRGDNGIALADQKIMELPTDGLDFNSEIAKLEEKMIRLALNRTSGNKNQAARLLKLNRTTLVEKIKKRGISL